MTKNHRPNRRPAFSRLARTWVDESVGGSVDGQNLGDLYPVYLARFVELDHEFPFLKGAILPVEVMAEFFLIYRRRGDDFLPYRVNLLTDLAR
jgi:hypothetical protein